MDNHITAYCRIRDGRISKNDEWVYTSEKKGRDFLKVAYEEGLSLDYPKFYKMDVLGKLGILATDLLLRGSGIEKYSPGEGGIVLSNHNSSIEADVAYFESSKTYPSPSLFVYTLPNIVIGELGIRYKIKGENAFFISDTFDADWLHFYVEDLMARSLKYCITGWIDAIGDEYDVCLFLVEKSVTGRAFETDVLNKIYNHEQRRIDAHIERADY
ncbi:MAG: hypothetical protein QM727_06480 [Niabella sp.]